MRSIQLLLYCIHPSCMSEEERLTGMCSYIHLRVWVYEKEERNEADFEIKSDSEAVIAKRVLKKLLR